jgi:hypothetical protein
MPRLASLLSALAVTLALCGIASASASAACTSEHWCVGGNTLGAGEERPLDEETIVTENFTLQSPTVSIKVECSTFSIKNGELKGDNTISAESLTFGNCKNVSAPKCELEGTTITTKPIKISEFTAVGTEELTAKLEPETGASFASIKLKGSTCSIAGTQAIKGKAKITAPKGQIAATEQEIVANTGAAELEIGSSEAKLKGKAKLKLKSGSTWNFG